MAWSMKFFEVGERMSIQVRKGGQAGETRQEGWMSVSLEAEGSELQCVSHKVRLFTVFASLWVGES